MVGFLGCRHKLLALVRFFIHQYPQVLRATLNSFTTLSAQDLALCLVELQEVLMDLKVKSVKVPLDDILSLKSID